MTKKILEPPLYLITTTHVGLLQKAGATSTSAKWCSPGATSKKLQPNLFGDVALKVFNEKEMIREEVLLDGEDLYTNGVTSDQRSGGSLSTIDTGSIVSRKVMYAPSI